jgi:hypothetical protein
MYAGACRVPETTLDLDLARAPVEIGESKANLSRFMMVTLECSMPTKLDTEFLSDQTIAGCEPLHIDEHQQDGSPSCRTRRVTQIRENQQGENHVASRRPDSLSSMRRSPRRTQCPSILLAHSLKSSRRFITADHDPPDALVIVARGEDDDRAQHCGHGRIGCRLDPVAINPKRPLAI